VRFGVPYAGYALSALGRRDVRMAVIALPALLIAGFTLGRLWRALGAEAERRALEGTA
jgi:signal peptidase I